MDVHNLMEELVTQHVNIIYDLLKNSNSSWLSCDCENCRLDTISYVLNRIPPKYVVSGRGVTYSSKSVEDDHQLKADIDALSNEGIRLVSETKRPFHSLPRKDCEIDIPEIPSFNFPTFMGTILDGTTFEPIAGAKVTLHDEQGQLVEMVDRTWANPAKTYNSTRGTYSFWIKSLQTDKQGVTKKFHFTLQVEADDYTPIIYSFEVPVTSDAVVKNELNSVFAIKIKDLIMFKTDITNPMEEQ